MTRRLISSGSPFERDIGYSRAVVSDGWVFVAGTTGYDYAEMTMPERVEDQCRNALETIRKALAEAGASLDDVVRVRYILPDGDDWPPCWPVVSAAFARARPAATMIRAGLQTPEMKIEIEVTARLPRAGDMPPHGRGDGPDGPRPS
ncbi:RidA family protein [Frigidibacter sp. ROC022]|uniref:RidA family protein n=1 Tax=Frigidibacter sp. ROC022 TaxID=2971796 RepID=UPI00215A694A|nr:RidA family protein [Frigidibacter sp. ROC022]MCR8723204.1 RidA family protein [Frigidibacter sp. ROC022]